MRMFVATVLALVCVLTLTAGASGSQSHVYTLTFNEVGFDRHSRVLSRHDIFPEASSLSPDRQSLAYVPYVFNGVRSNDLRVAEIHSSRDRLLYRAPSWVTYVAWSPNGQTIAMTVGSNQPRPDDGIWLIEADGTGLGRVAESGSFLMWSPDSRQLAYSRWTGADWLTRVVSIDSGLTRDIAYGALPRWSPDGKSIALESSLDCDCPPAIRVAALDTGRVRQLARGRGPSWSPDSRRIAFIRVQQAKPKNSLWVVSSSGGRPRFLATRPRPDIAWSPDGRWIAFARVVRCARFCLTSLNLVPTGGGKARRLAAEWRNITPEAWTRSGRVLYSATRCCA